MRESEYTRSVDRLLPASIYHLKLNLAYSAGVPDSWYSGSRSDLWVEWKYLSVIPARIDLCSGRKPMLSQLQQDWLISRYREARRIAVIVGTPDGGVIYPGDTWRYVLQRTEFVRRLLPKPKLAQWIAGHCGGLRGVDEVLPVVESMSLAPTRAHP